MVRLALLASWLVCKVDRGDVTVDEATHLFEQARAAVIRHSQEERQQAGERPRL